MSKGRASGARSGPPRGPRARQEARRRQQEQERQAARTRRRRRLRVAGGTVAAVMSVIALELFLHRPRAEEQGLLSEAATAAGVSGCGTVRTIPSFPGDRDRTHVGGADLPELPPLSDYPSHPPVSGPHAPVTLGAGMYSRPPPIDRAIHSLEHAAVIVWYDPSEAASAGVARIRRFFGRGDQRNHVIVAPYDYPQGGAAGRLPTGTGMALAAWHRMQLCASPNLAVAYEFVSRYRFDVYRFWEYRGDAPERWFTPI